MKIHSVLLYKEYCGWILWHIPISTFWLVRFFSNWDQKCKKRICYYWITFYKLKIGNWYLDGRNNIYLELCFYEILTNKMAQNGFNSPFYQREASIVVCVDWMSFYKGCLKFVFHKRQPAIILRRQKKFFWNSCAFLVFFPDCLIVYRKLGAINLPLSPGQVDQRVCSRLNHLWRKCCPHKSKEG